MFASLESSNNGYDNQKVWTVKSSKDGQRYNLEGTITTAFANENNYFNVLPFASSNTTRELTCPSHFYMATLNKDDKVAMNGTVNETTAEINWYFTDSETGWNVTGTFKGDWWDGGAKLDLSGASPATSGEAKRIDCEHCDHEDDADESFGEKNEKKIIGGAVVGGIVVLAAVAVGAWFFWQWFRKRQYRETRQVDDQDAWALEDHHDEREFKSGASVVLKTVDTSYDPARSTTHLAEGFEYKDSYTPLK
jgi:hypothetical protein